jgi:hypothetical protein
MPNDNFGPWTTSLTTGSRLEFSAFWKGRLTRLAGVADGRLTARRHSVGIVLTVGIVVTLFPMFRAQSEPVGAFEPKETVVSEIVRSPSVDETEAPQEVALNAVAITGLAPEDPQARELQNALRDAIAYLSGLQHDNGSWNDGKGNTFHVGITSLGALALARAGVKPNDLRLRRAAEYLRAQQPKMTYELALQTLALCALDPKRDAELIQRNVIWLEEGQKKEGPRPGGWGYGSGGPLPTGGGDNSNSDFAIWGLDAAAKAGAKVRRETWEAALDCWLRCQTADGGWSYTNGQPSTGSMTTAGVASVAICLSHVTNEERKVSEKEQVALDRGLKWMKTHFAVGHNPGGSEWLLYYAVMFRRAADATKTERLGDHDWRREWAEYLLNNQNRQTGTWIGGSAESNPVLGTSLVLLALLGADPVPPKE